MTLSVETISVCVFKILRDALRATVALAPEALYQQTHPVPHDHRMHAKVRAIQVLRVLGIALDVLGKGAHTTKLQKILI